MNSKYILEVDKLKFGGKLELLKLKLKGWTQ